MLSNQDFHLNYKELDDPSMSLEPIQHDSLLERSNQMAEKNYHRISGQKDPPAKRPPSGRYP